MLSFKFQITWEVWISVSFLSRKSSLERLRDNLNWKFAEVLHLLTIPEKVSDLVWQADSISVVKHVHYLHSSLTKLHFRLDTVLIDKNLWGSNAKKTKETYIQTQNRFSSGFATIFDTDRPVPLAFEGHISTIHEIILSWNLTPWRSIQ